MGGRGWVTGEGACRAALPAVRVPAAPEVIRPQPTPSMRSAAWMAAPAHRGAVVEACVHIAHHVASDVEERLVHDREAQPVAQLPSEGWAARGGKVARRRAAARAVPRPPAALSGV